MEIRNRNNRYRDTDHTKIVNYLTKNNGENLPKLEPDLSLAVPLGGKKTGVHLQQIFPNNMWDIICFNKNDNDIVIVEVKSENADFSAFGQILYYLGNAEGYMQVTSYLFSWDDIPGNDNDRLIESLKKNFGIEWTKTAKIEKIDGGKTIKIFTEKNSLSLKLNDKKTEVNLTINDVMTDQFIAKMENSKLNIYDEQNVNKVRGIILAKEIDKSLKKLVNKYKNVTPRIDLKEYDWGVEENLIIKDIPISDDS